MFIRKGLNPYTRQSVDLFDWPTLEPFVGSVEPGVALTTSTAQRVSRIGGAPEFVDEWPQGDSGPIPFLCHVDLAELAAQAGSQWPKRFPSSGVLSLFYDEAAALQSARSQSRPFALIADPDTRRRRARGEPCATSYSEVALEVARVTRPTAPLHQVGGLPQWIQSPDAAAGHFLSGAYLHYPDVVAALHDAGLDERCFLLGHDAIISAGRALDASGVEPARIATGLRHWRLVLQIAAEPAIGLNLGDVGRLYVFADLRTDRLTSIRATWVELQYY